MIDHLSFSVNDFEKSVQFYDSTLAILGYQRLMTFDTPHERVAGYGKDGKPHFWIGIGSDARKDEEVGRARGFHIAFLAPSTDAVDAWYQKCLELSGRNNGKPGPRAEYHPGYYGAFIIDPNGWRLEAVLHNYQAHK